MFRILFLVAALPLLAACQSGPAPKRVEPGAAAKTPTATAYLKGRAFYLERIALPPGATLDVLLIAEPAVGEPSAIAQQRFDALRGPPFEFALAYDPARIQAGTPYALRATLRDARGHLQFYTGSRVEVMPGSAQTVELRLQRATGD